MPSSIPQEKNIESWVCPMCKFANGQRPPPPKKKTPERTENRAKETTTKTVFVTVMEQFDSVCGGFSFAGDSHATDNSSGNVPLPMLIHRLHTELSSLSFVVRINETLCLEFEKNVITVHNSSCGKVMFLQVSGGGIVHPRADTPPGQRLPETATAADGTHHTGTHSCLYYFVSSVKFVLKIVSICFAG